MPSRELPKRAALVGPQRPVDYELSADVLGRYLEALKELEAIERATHDAGVQQVATEWGCR
ncbi:hypothetical protein OH799_26695 [Nocardia sp. NBC_00881]|uniref:hypothetical protein n=1 Tax=Nocardia sp. NBC_00881 TaxID=2975995 RepID=UPI00386FA872|nr:hypothetical protein OH799_26695 [Nocardia sp. NBC_00881]